jgi:DNA-binding transcriptional LysR family regulator
MRALHRFHGDHPEVLVHPAAMTSVNIVEALGQGRLAVGIVRGPIDDRAVSAPLARVPVDHVVVPLAHRLAASSVVEAADLDGEPVLVVDRNDAPRAHDEITGYLAALGVHPKWVTHGATQIERVFDLIAIGSGIGWLNTWQAEREAGRVDVAVRPLRPVGLWDDFRVAWRHGDTRLSTAACVRVVLETCGT